MARVPRPEIDRIKSELSLQRLVEASGIELKGTAPRIEEVLGRSLDELQPQTRRLLLLIHEAVERETKQFKIERSDFRFSRKHARAWTSWGDSALKKDLARLEDMEYLLMHRGGRGQSFVCDLVFQPG